MKTIKKTTEFKINVGKIEAIEKTMNLWTNVTNFYLEILNAYSNYEISINVKGSETTKKLLEWTSNKKRCLTALEQITTTAKMHPNPPVQLPYDIPTDFRRSCINFAIGTYRSYQYHNEVYQLAKKYLNYARYKKKRMNKALKPLIKDYNKRWHVVKRLSKYHKTGTLDPPKFPVVNPHRIDFYGSMYEDLKEAKSGYFIKVKLFDGAKWDWFRIPVIVEGYHKKTLEEVSKILSPSIRVRNNKLFIYFPVEKESTSDSPEEHVVSIDLGLRNLATITVNEKETRKLKKVYFISGRIITAFWRKVDYILSKIRSASKNHNKNLVKKWYSLLSKTNNWIAHCVSKKIVNIAEEFKNSVIVFEDLKFDSRNRLNSRNLNRQISLWMQGKIKELTDYKAMWRGIKIGKRVDPFHTSQYHYLDGTKGERFSPSPKKRGNSLFRCRECVEIINSDFNAAQNIFKRYIGIEPNEPIYKIGSKGEVVSPEEHVLFKEKAYQTCLSSFV